MNWKQVLAILAAIAAALSAFAVGPAWLLAAAVVALAICIAA